MNIIKTVPQLLDTVFSVSRCGLQTQSQCAVERCLKMHRSLYSEFTLTLSWGNAFTTALLEASLKFSRKNERLGNGEKFSLTTVLTWRPLLELPWILGGQLPMWPLATVEAVVLNSWLVALQT